MMTNLVMKTSSTKMVMATMIAMTKMTTLMTTMTIIMETMIDEDRCDGKDDYENNDKYSAE